MLKRILSVAAIVALAGVVLAAEPIKLDLSKFKWESKSAAELGGFDEGESRFFFYTFGSAVGDVEIPADGEYTITIEASCTAALKEMAKFKLTVGETEVAKEFSLKEEDKKEYTLTAKLKKGKQSMKIEFLNDKFKEGEYDLNLFVHNVKVEAKPEAKPIAKPEAKPEAKVVVKPEAKVEVKNANDQSVLSFVQMPKCDVQIQCSSESKCRKGRFFARWCK